MTLNATLVMAQMASHSDNGHIQNSCENSCGEDCKHGVDIQVGAPDAEDAHRHIRNKQQAVLSMTQLWCGCP